jgi:hypothetical protein
LLVYNIELNNGFHTPFFPFGDAAVPVVVTCALESQRHLYGYRRWFWGSPVTDDGFGVSSDSDDGFGVSSVMDDGFSVSSDSDDGFVVSTVTDDVFLSCAGYRLWSWGYLPFPLSILSIFYSQQYMNGIEQQAMPFQALSFLHVQGIHSLISVEYIKIISII